MTSMPVSDTAGLMPRSEPVARSWRLKAVGMEGPVMSASRMATFLPRRRMATAREEVTRLLPTPPLPLTTAMTLPILDRALAGASRLWGAVRSPQFSPQEEQLCVHSDIGKSFLHL